MSLFAPKRVEPTGSWSLHIASRPSLSGAEDRSSNAAVYAIGNAAGGMMLAHEAMHEGKVAAEVIAGKASGYDVLTVPAVVYTHPQIASCGLTQEQTQSLSDAWQQLVGHNENILEQYESAINNTNTDIAESLATLANNVNSHCRQVSMALVTMQDV